MLQTCTKAGGGVRDHGGGVGTALLRYLQLNVGKTNFGTFLAYFFHLGSQLLVHVHDVSVSGQFPPECIDKLGGAAEG